jgi:hypothetical protein
MRCTPIKKNPTVRLRIPAKMSARSISKADGQRSRSATVQKYASDHAAFD